MVKVKQIFKYIINNKRIMYLLSISVLLVFCLILNITFSLFTTSNLQNGVNITVGDLEYKMVINAVDLNSSVGIKEKYNSIIGDRILLSKSGNIEQFNISLISLNNYNTNYEIIYNFCKDQLCMEHVEHSKDIKVYYGSEPANISGVINANSAKEIIIVTENLSDKDIYIQVGLNAGYSHNTLILKNQINEYFMADNFGGSVKILAYVDGEQVGFFPTSDTYVTSVECTNVLGTKTNGFAYWTGKEWLMNVSSIDKGPVTCAVYFNYSEYPAPNGWFTASENTLLNSIKNDNIITEPKTVPGVVISDVSESVLASTPDDYGTSLYFRGNVQNNYVKFANMCWRIVRITGDGSIKLVLYNRNDNSVVNPCNSSSDGEASFAKYDGTNYKTIFNSSIDYHGSVGFMYGTLYSSSYEAEHRNGVDSQILKNLKSWYNLKLRVFNEYLADTIWCNDKSVISGVGYGGEYGDYASRGRIEGSKANVSKITLICPDQVHSSSLEKNLFKFTASDKLNGNGKLIDNQANEYKIGLLTADEVAFAGGVYISSNTSYYLYANATTSWWTMSPFYKNDGGVRVFDAINLNHAVVDNSKGLRPAISLKSNTQVVSGGKGTSVSPYEVKI